MTKASNPQANQRYFDRDISWLSFNSRVLDEAANPEVPLMERIRFLSIYSSNLDEFYRVRIPALLALERIKKNKKGFSPKNEAILNQAYSLIQQQQQRYGLILLEEVIPAMERQGVVLLFGKPIPELLQDTLRTYFFTKAAGFITINDLSRKKSDFFPENNKLYLAAQIVTPKSKKKLVAINVPSDVLPRFYSIKHENTNFIIFLEDILKYFLSEIFPGYTLEGAHSFKVTRDAALDLDDEYSEEVADILEKKITARDYGIATRFLHDTDMPGQVLELLIEKLQLQQANVMESAPYHNLKDLASLPCNGLPEYTPQHKINRTAFGKDESLFEKIRRSDIAVHPPYEPYDQVLRFFNEASLHPQVCEIYVTLYRVANDSVIANALINAAKNGKDVFVVVELKARFDEANNLKWAKKMKAAGVRIVYSVPSLKIHAKVALAVLDHEKKRQLFGLLSTGNFNESTARFYTDHILMTANQTLLEEAHALFTFLLKKKKKETSDTLRFRHLLVAQFGLREKFLALIDREIANAKAGLPASITIKMNNLEERSLIDKLYEASSHNVKVNLIIRSICCLIPDLEGLSENIRVRRIVDRYLEHGRIFLFHNGGDEKLFMGSSDWMNRNVYHRIEVCFPITDSKIQMEIKKILSIQLEENTKTVLINTELENIPISSDRPGIGSQEAIYTYLYSRN